MKWVEIITLRSPTNIHTQFVDELLKEIRESGSPTDTQDHSVEIRVYHHSVVETDASIHIYWNSEPGSPYKSPLGLRFSSSLKQFGLLNHSVWVETTARKSSITRSGKHGPGESRTPVTKENTVPRKGIVARNRR